MDDAIRALLAKIGRPITMALSAHLARTGKSGHSRAVGVILLGVCAVSWIILDDGRIDEEELGAAQRIAESLALELFMQDLGISSRYPAEHRKECMTHEAWQAWAKRLKEKGQYEAPKCSKDAHTIEAKKTKALHGS